ncbi:putative RNA uridine N3 methyltransferase [Acidianus sp. HS-5]|uniref:putative RNA uridine N3 methyltransferase n=1 Tax=Acidianus sp. HS-5 TaxID=2886040 RepID=UPI001F1E11DF|nr:putative RNA uridine N3 methyltransferase [Acidianus sp. HS-5]BDC19328.1 hypothetical protein HS5_22180 [Acidianus sp. HS-5]
MFPYKRRNELNIAFFSSIFSIEKNLTEKTLKASLLFRFFIEFRVTNVYIICPNSSNKEFELLKELSDYALTPPYLKKYIPISHNLKKVGLLSPMNLPFHIVHKLPIEGEIRIGKNNDFGLPQKIRTRHKSIIIVDSVKDSFIQYPLIYYNGFEIHKTNIEDILTKDNLIIGSRNGKDPLKYKDEIVSMYEEKGLTVLIGPPEGMLIKKLGENFLKKSYNFIIKQGVSDVRAEEAIISSLSLLNAILE